MSRALGLVNWAARHIIRPRLRCAKGPAAARKEFNLVARLLPLPRGTKFQLEEDGTLRVHAGPSPTDTVILYFHGGGYMVGSPWTHRRLAACLARESGLDVVLPAYRLIPENPAPAAFEDALSAYLRLSAEGRQIILGGDSAGGGLAFAVMAGLPADAPRPRGIFAFSPWTDLTIHASEREGRDKTDRLLPIERFEELCDFLGDVVPLADPRLSPARADLTDPPPALIQVAESEALFLDAKRMGETLRAAGGDVTISTLPDAPHVWQMLDLALPEARASLTEVGRFAKRIGA